MSELDDRLARAAQHISAGWDLSRTERAQLGLHRRQRRIARRRRITAAAALMMMMAGVGGLAWRWQRAEVAGIAAPARQLVSVGDGSMLELASGAEVKAAGAHATLLHGGLRAAIREGQGTVRIEAERVVVEARDARFALDRSESSLAVAVAEGQVHVLTPEGEQTVAAGEQHTFTLTVPPPPPDDPAPAKQAAPVESSRRETTRTTPKTTWQQLARDGEYERAYVLVAQTPVHRSAEDLLLAADVARLSHHPAEAVDPLRELLVRYAADPRAPLAAFTLGRVLLDELGRPTEAAAAFARAQALQPDGPLNEDAIAREVESWSRAGDSERAHQLADDYVRRYKDGRRVRAVRRFGGLD
jgi:transmembrane sensor